MFVLGGPGSGKGTQCARLSEKFHFHHISVGDILREEVAKGSALGHELDAIMKEGKIVGAELTLRLLRQALEFRLQPSSIQSVQVDPENGTKQLFRGFLIDGFPRELGQAVEFETKLTQCKFVLYFNCSERVMRERLLKRGETSGRADDNAETILKRFHTFSQQSMPLVEHYRQQNKLVEINCDGSIESVSEETIRNFERCIAE